MLSIDRKVDKHPFSLHKTRGLWLQLRRGSKCFNCSRAMQDASRSEMLLAQVIVTQIQYAVSVCLGATFDVVVICCQQALLQYVKHCSKDRQTSLYTYIHIYIYYTVFVCHCKSTRTSLVTRLLGTSFVTQWRGFWISMTYETLAEAIPRMTRRMTMIPTRAKLSRTRNVG